MHSRQAPMASELTFDMDQLCTSRATLEEILAKEFTKQAELLTQLVAEVRSLRDVPLQVTHHPQVDGPVNRLSRHSQDTRSSERRRPSKELREQRGSTTSSPGRAEHMRKVEEKGAERRATRTSSSEIKVAGNLEKAVTSTPFTYAVMLLICVNMILLGFQVDSANSPPFEEPGWYSVVNNVIVVIFVMELLLKFAAFGIVGFFCGPERGWNIFDLAIVVVSVVETILELAINIVMAGNQADSNQLRFLRIVKIARAMRGVRVMRLLRYISSLRAILFSISSTMWSLVWTLVLLLLLFYCFGVLVGQIVNDHCRNLYVGDPSRPCEAELIDFWGTVPECMLTLFLSISGGLSWNEAFMPLRRVSEIAAMSMVLYIIIAVFAVMNVVTGVFCNTAIENAKADKDIAIMKQMQKHRAQVDALRSVFNDIDCNQSKLVSIAELEEATRDLKFKSFMESMDISVKDIWTLFMIIDADQSGEITVDEFVSGCMQLEGPAKSLHVARMRHEMQHMKKDIMIMKEELVAEMQRSSRAKSAATWM